MSENKQKTVWKYLHGTIGGDTVLEAVKLPAGVTDLDTGLLNENFRFEEGLIVSKQVH